MTFRILTACVTVLGMAAPLVGQTTATTNMEILRQKLTADKKLVVAHNLQLTDAEGAAFWPVYDAYQKDLQAINQRLGAAIKAYADAYNKGAVTNETARKIIDDVLAIDDAEARLKAASAQKVLAVLPAVKATRYIQIESKIRAVVRYELASQIPFVE